MSKNKKVIVIGEQVYPLNGVTLQISLADLSKLLVEERKEGAQQCISILRPFVSSEIGRSRLDSIELGYDEVLVEVEEDVVEESKFIFIDDDRGEILEGVSFENVFQTIRRRK